MREIKFRVWSEKLKEMLLVDKLDLTGDEGAIVFDENADEHYFTNSPTMQYTGLKDKNGEHEIYEGDKVKTPAGIGFIEWRNGCFYIFWDEKYGTPLHNTHADLIEVVGNIYESYI